MVQSTYEYTILTFGKIVPVRMMKNEFYDQVETAYQRCASREELIELL